MPFCKGLPLTLSRRCCILDSGTSLGLSNDPAFEYARGFDNEHYH